MRQLPRPADTGVELLMTFIVAVAPVTLEQAVATVCQRQNSLAPVERHASHQPLIVQVSMAVVARVERCLARIAKVAFRDHPKCPNGCERAAVLGIEFVGTIPLVQHNLALEAAWQVEALHERVSGVPLAVSVE